MPHEGWQHRVCERCWLQRCVDSYRGEDRGVLRVPTQVRGAEFGRCCYCGGLTFTTAFVRESPKSEKLACRSWLPPAELEVEIREHPNRHQHTYLELAACCFVQLESGWAMSLALMEAHVGGPFRRSPKCDVISGPCSCGDRHGPR